MKPDKWQTKLCNNGIHYLWKDSHLYEDEEGYIEFACKEDGDRICSFLNEYEEQLEFLRRQQQFIRDDLAMAMKIMERYNLTSHHPDQIIAEPSAYGLIYDAIARTQEPPPRWGKNE